jgi:hypothetical protein
VSYDYATQRGKITTWPSTPTGDFTLERSHEGSIFRYEGSANITVTVPGDLPEGFNCGFLMYSTGTITLAAGIGAVNKSAKTALSTQYQTGSLMVSKATGFKAHEFLVGGDFA